MKSWLVSKTIWANSAGAAVTAINPEVQAYIVAHPKLAAVLAAVVNVVLRFVTKAPVE